MNPRQILSLLVLVFTFALAQNLTADEILSNLQTSAETLQDAEFLLTGQLIDTDGSTYDLEIEVQVIPGLQLGRAFIIQPDALADNFIIFDDNTVYNYLYLTNQVTILDASDPDALGGLLPEAQAEAEARLNLNLNVSELFDGWDMEVVGFEPSPVGNVYVLRFNNTGSDIRVSHVTARVVDTQWIPYTLEFVQTDGSTLATLMFTNFRRDGGLNPAVLRFIPADAEVIDER